MTASVDEKIGKLTAEVGNLKDKSDKSRIDRKEIYDRLGQVETAISHLPTEQEWDGIKAMAAAHADKKKFWSDLQRAMATRGLIAATIVFISYSWDGIWLAIKSKLGG